MPQGAVDAGDQQEFSDADFRIVDNADQSKKVAFQASGLTTATTRTLTVPNASTTIVGTDATQTLTNKSLVDASTSFIDDGDNTKILAFQLSGITTATTRTATWPDKSGTVAMTSDLGGMTLLGTLTTTSGTTQSLTGIGGYFLFYIEMEDVSFTANVALTFALSSTNGSAYGTAANVVTAGGTPNSIYGWLLVGGLQSTFTQAKKTRGAVSTDAVTAATDVLINSPTDTAAVANALRFAGGTFNAGTIRVYGMK